MAQGVKVFEIRKPSPPGVGNDDVETTQLLDRLFDHSNIVLGDPGVLIIQYQ
jgi:hypothetical protein